MIKPHGLISTLQLSATEYSIFLAVQDSTHSVEPHFAERGDGK